MNRKALVAVVLTVCMLAAMLTGCSCSKKSSVKEEGKTQVFTDSCGREVELAADVQRIAPSGAVAQMILTTIAPDLLVGLSATPSSDQMKYMPEYYTDLPTFGQMYGSKATLNMESLISAEPQVIIDLGDKKDGHKSDMDQLQKQTGVPTVFIEADLTHMAEAYRSLGKLIGREEQAEELASFIDETMNMAAENSAKITEDKKLSVMYGTGTTGLACNAKGSVQSTVIDLIGAENAVVVSDEELSNAGGGNVISMEQVYVFDPDVIILTEGGPFAAMKDSKEWSQLRAVQDDAYYEIPGMPYNWTSGPPSVNSVLGVWWLGNLVYPELYDYNMQEVAQKFYSLFYHYELSDEEAQTMLANSTLKAAVTAVANAVTEPAA